MKLGFQRLRRVLEQERNLERSTHHFAGAAVNTVEPVDSAIGCQSALTGISDE